MILLDGVEEKKMSDDLKRNGSGYIDLTAYEAIKNIEKRNDIRFEKFLGMLFSLSELCGFHFEERIVVKDIRTGKVYR